MGPQGPVYLRSIFSTRRLQICINRQYRLYVQEEAYGTPRGRYTLTYILNARFKTCMYQQCLQYVQEGCVRPLGAVLVRPDIRKPNKPLGSSSLHNKREHNEELEALNHGPRYGPTFAAAFCVPCLHNTASKKKHDTDTLWQALKTK
jgi:hypothetical protein